MRWLAVVFVSPVVAWLWWLMTRPSPMPDTHAAHRDMPGDGNETRAGWAPVMSGVDMYRRPVHVPLDPELPVSVEQEDAYGWTFLVGLSIGAFAPSLPAALCLIAAHAVLVNTSRLLTGESHWLTRQLGKEMLGVAMGTAIFSITAFVPRAVFFIR